MHTAVLTWSELVIELVGTLAFGLSGALLAVRKNYDIIGIAALAEVTATGGGIARDVIIGAVPPEAFTHLWYLLLPLVAAGVTLFFHRQLGRISTAVQVFDAAGLGLFCVAGTAKALAYGLGPVQAVVLGVITGIGGGVARDILAREPPTVFRANSRLYAVPAMLGSIVVVVASRLGVYGPVAAALAAAAVTALRLGALRYGWQAPIALRWERPGAGTNLPG